MKNNRILTSPYGTDFTIKVIKKALYISPEKIIEEINKSNLLGRGGAAFPTGVKWSLVKKFPSDEKFIIANAEEGEPGTFKDRFLLRNYPYKLIDGMIIASIAIGIKKGFIYINCKYQQEKKLLEKILISYKKKGLLGKDIISSAHSFEIKIVESIGRYITGEETSLFNVLEGERPIPRIKPPYPPEKGLFNKPTLINNVETLSLIPYILYYGGKWFTTFGSQGNSGTKLISLSGDIVNKGVYEVELGKIRIRDILTKYGKVKSLSFVKALLPSATSPFIFPEKFSMKYDYSTLLKNGINLGTGGMIIYGKRRNLLGEITKLMKFFVEESCGYCMPCRIGGKRVYETLIQISRMKNFKKDEFEEKLNLLKEISEVMREASRCPLGQGCINPLLSWIELYQNGKIKSFY